MSLKFIVEVSRFLFSEHGKTDASVLGTGDLYSWCKSGVWQKMENRLTNFPWLHSVTETVYDKITLVSTL